MPGEISGFGIVAATISVPLAMSCEPSEKVSQLIIQGQFDTILPYNGSNNGALSLLSAKKLPDSGPQKMNAVLIPLQQAQIPLQKQLITANQKTTHPYDLLLLEQEGTIGFFLE